MQHSLPQTVLIVEDEAMVAMDLADCVGGAGFRVLGPVNTLTDAIKVATGGEFDAALLDANLRGQPVTEVAAVLTSRNIPYAFVTGYGREVISDAFHHVPLIAKPYAHDDLILVIRTLLRQIDGARPA
jgi:CheY-like chemotaxis protein